MRTTAVVFEQRPNVSAAIAIRFVSDGLVIEERMSQKILELILEFRSWLRLMLVDDIGI